MKAFGWLDRYGLRVSILHSVIERRRIFYVDGKEVASLDDVEDFDSSKCRKVERKLFEALNGIRKTPTTPP